MKERQYGWLFSWFLSAKFPPEFSISHKKAMTVHLRMTMLTAKGSKTNLIISKIVMATPKPQVELGQ
jgi:hypothetical protein